MLLLLLSCRLVDPEKAVAEAEARANALSAERCNGVDDDGDGEVDENPEDGSFWYADTDGDGFGNPTMAHLACPEGSAEGWVEDATDCDDENAAIYPGTVEQFCDGLDENCDGQVDEGLTTTWYQDHDGDGYGGEAGQRCSDNAEGWVQQGADCDDQAAAVFPEALEVCNGVDDDCDGATDDADSDVDPASMQLSYADADGDGAGSEPIIACASSGAPRSGDCDDGNPAVYAGAPEICDSLDND